MAAGNKILLPQLVSLLSVQSGKPKKQTEAFLKAFFSTITSALEEHDSVKIKGFGTFKVNRVEARKSVNVSTGAELRIPAHYKVVFTPAKTMAEKVNSEFSWLEIIEISDAVSTEELDIIGTETNSLPKSKIPAAVVEVPTAPAESIRNEEIIPEKESEEVATEEKIISEIAKPAGEPEKTTVAEGTMSEEPVIGKLAEINAGPEETEVTEETVTEEPFEQEVDGKPEEENIVEIPQVNQEEPRKEIIVKAAEIADLTPREEEKSEELGEEIEKEFGDIEPVEPFGPIDPEDPEPGTPEQSQDASAIEEPHAEQQEAESLNNIEAEQTLISEPFYETDENPPSPFYITKEEYENLATKNELRIVQRNLKKLRNIVENSEEKNKKRSRAILIWSIIICAALITGGFFLVYNILKRHMGEKAQIEAVQETPTAVADVSAETEDSIVVVETETVTEPIPKLSSEAKGEPQETQSGVAATTPVKENASKTTTKTEGATAPTNPSDIKAMDKITNTRYLTTMAKEYYGNYNLWPYIYMENEGKLGHPDRIKPGTPVVIPHIEKYGINPSNPKDIEKARKLGVEIYRKFSQ